MYKQSRKPAVMALVLVVSLATGFVPGRLSAATGMYEPHSREPSAGAMAVDVVAVRPLGIVATVLGTGLFIVSLPFSALGGNVDEAAEALVVKPARFTFLRPLGEYDAHY